MFKIITKKKFEKMEDRIENLEYKVNALMKMMLYPIETSDSEKAQIWPPELRKINQEAFDYYFKDHAPWGYVPYWKVLGQILGKLNLKVSYKRQEVIQKCDAVLTEKEENVEEKAKKEKK